MNKTLYNILHRAVGLCKFLERYSLGHIKEESQKLKTDILRYLEEDKEINDKDN